MKFKIIAERSFAKVVDVFVLLLLIKFFEIIFRKLGFFETVTVYVFISILYKTIFCHGRFQTLGQFLVFNKVVTSSDEQASLLKTFKRAVISKFSLLLIGMGYFAIFFDEDARTLHDRFSDCKVKRLV